MEQHGLLDRPVDLCFCSARHRGLMAACTFGPKELQDPGASGALRSGLGVELFSIIYFMRQGPEPTSVGLSRLEICA